jgi:hypothetical protein
VILPTANAMPLRLSLPMRTTKQAAISMLNGYWKGCTLQTPVSKDKKTTWKLRCEAEATLSQ